MKKITEMKELCRRKERPVRVMQYGDGNFLRAFVDYGIDVANEENGFDSNVAIIIPTKPHAGNERRKRLFAGQDNYFTVCLRGKKAGKPYKENRVVSCISEVLSCYTEHEAYIALAENPDLELIVSNTTEAGIVYEPSDKLEDKPAEHFPAKLAQFLYHRFRHFEGDMDKGLVMLPAELIDHNGEQLLSCVLKYIELWQLDPSFREWVQEACIFANTMVDRIVPGYPKEEASAITEELGYEDQLLDQAEPFGLWVIGTESLKERLPLNSDKLDVVFTDRIEAYKERKVRILNGAHTSMVLGAYLAGLDYVGQAMADEDVRRQLEQSVFGELVPTVHLPREEAEAFARAVFERFENPFVKHALLSISLNSISKWRARVLPSIKDTLAEGGTLPPWLTYSLAALLAFYRTEEKGEGFLIGKRGQETYEIRDDADKLDFIAAHAGERAEAYARAVMEQADWWGEDLTKLPGFFEAVLHNLQRIEAAGARQHIRELGEELGRQG